MLPVSFAVKPTSVLRHLVESGVRIPREQVLAALQAYVDGLEQATLQAIDAGKGALSDSVDDLSRRQDLANRASNAATRLRNELFDALAAAARPEDRPVIDAVRANEAVRAAETEVEGHAGIVFCSVPNDLGGWLMPMGAWGGTPEEYRHRVLLAATNSEARVAALVLARKRVAEAELDAVRRRFGMMFQDGALFSSLTVAQNVAVPLREHTRLAPATIDALVAGFPAGTVSGAPKVRAMEIVDELERNKRGVYAGCVGYFSADGEMDTCIVLRTAIVKDGKMYVQAGAGVVADSIPESEHQECVNKAKALFRAAEEAVRFAGRAGRAQ